VRRRQGPKQEKATVRISCGEIKTPQALVPNVRLPKQNDASAESLQDLLGTEESISSAFRLD
jgi:hypothetical protein